jgi:UDP-N-acetylmuramate--alanine ligase
MVGIGGTGMSGIAEVLHNLEFTVTGSDLERQKSTRRLSRMGIKIFYGHEPKNVDGADVIVISSAIRPANPEVVRAQELKIPVIPRAEMLAELMRLKLSIAVSGAHGKTTVTSMIGKVLEVAGHDPTIVVGGRLMDLGGGGKLGRGDYLVAEADESDGSFLKLSPTLAVVTNIDEEHMEAYGSFDRLRDAFVNFSNSVPFYGCTFLNLDDMEIQRILPRIHRRAVTYGIARGSQVSGQNVELTQRGSRFRVYVEGELVGTVDLKLPGLHNVKNALAAFAVGMEVEIEPGAIMRALSAFKGVHRRFEIKGRARGITVLDDYAHHPTEIEAVLEATSRFWKGRSVVCFQPHRYSRTKRLHRRFGHVFHQTDVLVLTRLYPAGEKEIPGVGTHLIYNAVKETGHREVYHIEDREELMEFLRTFLRKGDLLITMGAGDIWKVGDELLKEWKGR